MKIRHLSIRNFRGIQELEWHIVQPLICLIGQGDSTKSTILDAINLCLSPSSTLAFTDADFFNCEINNPIEIITTVGELPDLLISQDKFGNYLQGWSIDRGLIDEPEDDTEPVLSILLTVDNSLEPKWLVMNNRVSEGIIISATDRRKIGVTTLGMYMDQQLSWGKYSALSRLTDNDDDISSVLADASRRAREAVSSAALTELNKSAEKANEIAKTFGVKPHNQYVVGLDAKLSVTGQATLTLHDGQIPTRMAGFGSRRLLTLAIQHESVPDGGIMLVDEIEIGLEPHRLRHLIRKLRPNDESKQQIFITTHSSVAIEECNAEELNIVHNNNGKIDIRPTSQDLQALVRKTSEAFLATKIIACEGATEVGFVRKIENFWQTTEGGKNTPFACLGVFPVTSTGGGGTEMPKNALLLQKLGYHVAFLGDSDVPLNPTEEELETAGVKVLVWQDSKSIEERICLDLPFGGLDEFIEEAVNCVSERGKPTTSVYDSIGSEFKLNSGEFQGKVQFLLEKGHSEDTVRRVVGQKAKDKGWFKRISYGEHLAKVVIQNLGKMTDTDVLRKLTALRVWANES